MSTRGCYGIRKNGIDKLTYNHCDSYPDYLGREFIDFCKENGPAGLNKIYDLLVMVDECGQPTAEQKDYCLRNGYCDLMVSNKSTDDWYCLLHELMGNFPEYTKCAKENRPIFMIEDSGFIKDSLFCEYAYIVNLDTGMLEYYVGFQRTPDKKNRYGHTPDSDGYYPCKMVMELPLDDLPDSDELVEKMNAMAA